MGRYLQDKTQYTKDFIAFNFISNGQTDFTLTHQYKDPIVFVGGAIQRKDIDYTIDGTTLSFTNMIANGLNVFGYLLDLKKTTSVTPTIYNSVERFTGDGTSSTFILNQYEHISSSMLVFVDGILLKSSEFSIVNNILTVTPTPSNGANVSVLYFEYPVKIKIPTDNSIKFDDFTTATKQEIAHNNNILINGNFDVWQRGTSFNSDGYTADRWRGDFAEGFATSAPVGVNQFTIGTDNFLAISNYFNGTTYNINSHIYKFNSTTSQFELYQSIPTNGALTISHFELNGGDNYIGISNHFNGATYNLNSWIYKWNTSTLQFEFYQTIPTSGAIMFSHFELNGDDYIGIPNNRNSSSRNLNSWIYKWNTSTLQFELYQTIPTNGGLLFSHFELNGDDYISIPNNYNGSTFNLNSWIYKWNTSTLQFEFYQTIPTIGAREMMHFQIGGENYLTVTNHRNTSTFNVNSWIYKWNTSTLQFEFYQTVVSGRGTYYSDFFEINNRKYLIFSSFRTDASYNLITPLHTWNDTTLQFELYTTQDADKEVLVPTVGARSSKFFTINTETYLAVANLYNGGTFNVNSEILKWNTSTSEFDSVQLIPTNGALHIKPFVISSDQYIFVCNFYNGSSYIYKWDTVSEQFTLYQTFATVGCHNANVFEIGGKIILGVANYSNGSTHHISTDIYEWNTVTEQFDIIQVIPSTGCVYVTNFNIDGNDYIALAEYVSANGSVYTQPSDIYKWNTVTEQFDTHHQVTQTGVRKLHHVPINGEHYLICPSHFNGTTFNITTNVLKWNPSTEEFVQYQGISTEGAYDVDTVTINGDVYLAIANLYNGSSYVVNSTIYKWNSTTLAFELFQSITTHGASYVEFREIGSEIYLFIANYRVSSTFHQNSKMYRWDNDNQVFQSTFTGPLGHITRQPNNTYDVPNNPNYTINLKKVRADNNAVAIEQRIEDVLRFSNETLTISFYAKADAPTTLYFNSSTVGVQVDLNGNDILEGGDIADNLSSSTSFNLTSTWTKFEYTFTIADFTDRIINDPNYLSIGFSHGGTGANDVHLSQIKLEHGSHATLFIPKHISEELAECQRYYEKSYDVNTIPRTKTELGAEYRYAPFNVSNVSYKNITYKTEKRNIPTITIYPTDDTIISIGDIFELVDISLINNIYDKTADAYYLPVINHTGSNGFTIESNSTLPQNNEIFFHWTVDSEL